MNNNQHNLVSVECKQNIVAVQDALDILTGKWRVPIIVTLTMRSELLFNELKAELPVISAKVLTEELHYLYKNNLISREVLKTKPIKVKYKLTEYGRTLENVIFTLLDWGLTHRERFVGKRKIDVSNAEYIGDLRSNLPAHQ
ncbi:helix-turn-helix domain-containing protein [Pedobacter miscanthi]|uniref:winged helix-turn-helix transcriptional regulator n=1 Tax=Pedobacter miscanthi TaxID=2259170 RepID=UPI00292CBF6C|nr:helix-turn-helix domain-containing protein [Pedobacter miscanthi]